MFLLFFYDHNSSLKIGGDQRTHLFEVSFGIFKMCSQLTTEYILHSTVHLSSLAQTMELPIFYLSIYHRVCMCMICMCAGMRHDVHVEIRSWCCTESSPRQSQRRCCGLAWVAKFALSVSKCLYPRSRLASLLLTFL